MRNCVLPPTPAGGEEGSLFMEGPKCLRRGKGGIYLGFPAPGQSLQGVEEVDSESSWSSYGIESECVGVGC